MKSDTDGALIADGADVLRWLTAAVERDVRARVLAGTHEIDVTVFDRATGRYLCRRCDGMVDAAAWSKPCAAGGAA